MFRRTKPRKEYIPKFIFEDKAKYELISKNPCLSQIEKRPYSSKNRSQQTQNMNQIFLFCLENKSIPNLDSIEKKKQHIKKKLYNLHSLQKVQEKKQESLDKKKMESFSIPTDQLNNLLFNYSSEKMKKKNFKYKQYLRKQNWESVRERYDLNKQRCFQRKDFIFDDDSKELSL